MLKIKVSHLHFLKVFYKKIKITFCFNANITYKFIFIKYRLCYDYEMSNKVDVKNLDHKVFFFYDNWITKSIVKTSTVIWIEFG